MAVVSGERARATWLTGAAGLLALAVAVVMMVAAAPTQSRPHHVAAPIAGRQLTPRTASTTVRAFRAGPSAPSDWAEAYTPSMITESWSATSSARSPLATSAAS